MFRRRSDSLIGLDIGSSSVKALQFSSDTGRLKLEHAALVGIESNGNWRDATAKAIHDAISQIGKYREVAASVAGPSVAVRHLRFPRLSPDELKGALWWEGAQVIPFDMEDVFTDFQVMGNRENETERLDVLFVAAARQVVNDRISLLRECGLEPRVIDVDSLAILNCFLETVGIRGNGPVAILNIGARLTNLAIVNDNSTPFIRDIMTAGNDFSQAVAEAMDIPFPQAERLKTEEIRSIPSHAVDLMESKIRGLIEELTGSFKYYQAKEAGGEPKTVFLTGGTTGLPYLRSLISDELGLPVRLWNPLENAKIDHGEFDQPFIREIGPFMAVAAGLALRKNP